MSNYNLIKRSREDQPLDGVDGSRESGSFSKVRVPTSEEA